MKAKQNNVGIDKILFMCIYLITMNSAKRVQYKNILVALFQQPTRLYSDIFLKIKLNSDSIRKFMHVFYLS